MFIQHTLIMKINATGVTPSRLFSVLAAIAKVATVASVVIGDDSATIQFPGSALDHQDWIKGELQGGSLPACQHIHVE